LGTDKGSVHPTWVKHHGKRNVAILGSGAFIIVIIAIVIIGFLGAEVKIGQKAPDFTLQDVMTGSNFHLYDLNGKSPVVLEFMRTTCSHCIYEAPILSQLHSTYQGKVAFVSVSIDDQPSVLRSFAHNYNSTWYWLIDNGATTTNMYGISGTPTIFLLDKNLVVQNLFNGQVESSKLQAGIQSILAS
jgi:cytochrome c biogenesis protein CcmG, thiol:disulfide interchange protein DsbE